MIISTLISMLKKAGKNLILTLIWLGLWQILSAVVGLSVILPSPLETLAELCNLGLTKDFWLSIGYSVLRITSGFLAGTLAGVLCGILSESFKTVNSFFIPFVSIIKATPVASFIVMAVVWLKSSNVPSFATSLIVFPFIYSNVKTGIKETDLKLIEMSKSFNVKPAKMIKKLYIPSVMPYFVSASTTAMGLAWKAGIAAEVICTPTLSIGSGIYNSKIYLETPSLFAWTSVIVLMSILLEKTMIFILKRGKKNDKN